MQVLPKTGKILAKQLKMRYNKKALYDAELQLQLGMLYIANLVRLTGAPEYAAAAYNAGEDRIALWKSERNYEEIPELVESIPFTRDPRICANRLAQCRRLPDDLWSGGDAHDSAGGTAQARYVPDSP